MTISIQKSNPIRVGDDTLSAATEIRVSRGIPIKISYIYWFNPTTAGHLCTLKTSDGEYIAELRCESDGQSEKLGPLDIHVKDIYCDDLDSGTLYIYTQ